MAPWHFKLLSQLAAATMAGGDAGAALAHMGKAVEVSRSTRTNQLVSVVLLAYAAMHCFWPMSPCMVLMAYDMSIITSPLLPK